MKRTLLFVLAMIAVLSAAFVPVDRARTVAENQYIQYCADQATKSANIINIVENKYEGVVTWYAFEFEKGFVIVSADDAVRPILGYSDHGKVPKADGPGGENFKEWFGNYDKQIAYVRENKIVDETGQKTWKMIEANEFSSTKASIIVDRLVKSSWDQVWPWNDQCPLDGGAATYVGCVATAMAQVTRYHQWPDVGEGFNEVDFTTHTFNYDLMPLEVDFDYTIWPEYQESGSLTQAMVDELAIQSYWMGLSVNMSYAADGSGAQMSAVPTAFLNNWKASSSALSSFATPPAGGTDASYNTIKAQLDAKRPWVWAGGIHAFVLDGYRDDYWYHFNWGWGGSYDGWFHRSSLIPDGVGSGGGDGDYTSGQVGVTYVPEVNPYTAWPSTTVNGSLTNGEDVSLTWSSQTGAVEYKVYRTKDKAGLPALIATTTSTSYSDNNLAVGTYAYHVVVVYSDNESHNSNVYSASIDYLSDYKYPTGLNGSAVGRTSIDISWVKPYTGMPILSEGWETGTLNGWTLYSSGTFSTIYGWTPDDDTRWMVADVATYAVDPEYIHDGLWTNYIGYNAGGGTNYEFSWIVSPQITIGSSNELEFWVWYNNNSPEGSGLWPTDMWFVFYETTNPFTESSGTAIAANCYALAEWDGEVLVANDPINWGNNKFETPVHFDLTQNYENVSTGTPTSLIGKTGRIGFIYDYNDGYQAAIDDVVYGSTVGGSTEPLGYEVYRNGSLATTISGPTNVTWSDTGFIDGDNSYFVRATYPGSNVSIPSIPKTISIEANPKPYYLNGAYNGEDIDLAWYQPYMNPPMWYCYYDVYNSTTTIDMMDVPAPQRRVEFATDAGYYYPVTIDSIGAIFYEWQDDPWSTSQFDIRIVAMGFYAPGGGFLPDTTLWEATNQTAVPGEFFKIELPTPLVRTKGWAVEVYAAGSTTGHPGNLAGPSPDGDVHSFFYYSTESSYDYYMVTGGQPAEYAIMSHLTSSDAPPIAKNSGWTGPEFALPDMEGKAKADVVAVKSDRSSARKIAVDHREKDSKALDTYYIYRNDSYIGQSAVLSYTDTNPIAGDNTYYVTAVYTNPAGESDPSNEITLGPPPVIGVPASIAKTVASGISDTGTFDISNTGLGSLNYSLSFEYTDVMSQTLTPVDEHFASSLGTFTSSANWAYSTTTPVYETGYARIASINNATRLGYLTSQAFDVSGLVNTKLNFVYLFSSLAGGSLSVQYSTDGTNYTELTSYTAAQTTWKTTSLNIPDTAVRVRFYGYFLRGNGQYAGVDVIQVTGDEYLIDPWFSFVSAFEGTVISQSSNTITCGYDATNLPDGEYHANVIVDSNDEVNPQIITPVVFTVGGTGPVIPAVPANLVTSVVGGQLVIGWDVSADATEYYVYSSADPYGTYTQIATAPSNTYTYAGTETKMFFYVIAGNATKTAPKTITIRKNSSR